MTQPALSIALLPLPVDTSEGAASSPNTESPRSAPLSSPSHAIGHNGEGQRDFPNPAALRRASLTAPPAPIMPSQNVEPSKTLFSNVSASKSSARIPENSMSQVPDLKRSDPKSDKILSHGNSGQPLANPSNVVGREFCMEITCLKSLLTRSKLQSIHPSSILPLSRLVSIQKPPIPRCPTVIWRLLELRRLPGNDFPRSYATNLSRTRKLSSQAREQQRQRSVSPTRSRSSRPPH